MTWFVYLLECRGGSIYTGICIDVAARYAQHASGKGARYTRAHPPVRLLAAFACADRSAATRREIEIKRLPASAKRELAAEQLPVNFDSRSDGGNRAAVFTGTLPDA